MPEILQYDVGEYHLKIEYNNTKPILAGQPLANFSNALDALAEAASLTSFQVKRLADPSTDYSYVFVSEDGAEWHQTIRMINPVMTEGHYDFWDAEGVIEKHQTVRRAVMGLIAAYDIVKIIASWD